MQEGLNHPQPASSTQFTFFLMTPTERTSNASCRRRSQRSGMTWELLDRFAAEWLPEPKILHPYPNLRFDAKHLR